MSNLSKYVDKIREYKRKHPDLTEPELIMYVYLDLGLRFKFDQDYFFKGTKERKKIYERSRYIDKLNGCFDDNKIICRSAAYIMQYVLTELGVKIRTIVDEEDVRQYKHVYNIITPADGSEEYKIDLQEDMIYMHYHAFTKEFGLSTDGKDRPVISREEQKRMHLKFGYITERSPYVDEYIYLFKEYIGLMDSFYDKIDFVLKNIDPIDYPSTNYWERRWKHDRFLKELFSKDDLRKLNVVEFFNRKEDGIKEYINGFFVDGPKGVVVYIYSKDDNAYRSYTIQEVAQMVKYEGLEHNQKIKGLNRELLRLKMDEGR